MKVLLYPVAITFLVSCLLFCGVSRSPCMGEFDKGTQMAMTTIPTTNGQGLGGLLSGLPLPILASFCLEFGFSIGQFDKLFAGIFTYSIVYRNIVPIINDEYNKLGTSECAGLDHTTGVPLFALFSCIWNGNGNVDFGGNTLCSYQCNDGTCVPYQNITQAPVTAYPFGCNCPSTSCTKDGPTIPAGFVIPGTKVTCKPEPGCNCALQNPSNPNATGYLCNWVNVKTDLVINLQSSVDQSLSPIRWCTCCA